MYALYTTMTKIIWENLMPSDVGIFLGYSSQSKAYKVLNKRTNRVEKSVHVVFNEHTSEEGNSEDEQNEGTCSKPSEPIYGKKNLYPLITHLK